LLISAFSSISRDFNFKLSIVGGGDLVSIIPTNDDRIQYYKRGEREEVVKLYQKSDILVVPSRWKPYGLVVLEALSCGFGVVVTEKLRGSFDEFEFLGVLMYTLLDIESIRKAMKEMALQIKTIRSNYVSVRKIILQKHEISKVTGLLLDNLGEKYF
jgi:glycosyltransferase involved in cell wall biosynthesis